MASLTAADVREYIDLRRQETTVARKAYTSSGEEKGPVATCPSSGAP